MPDRSEPISFCRASDHAIIRVSGAGTAMQAPAVVRCAQSLFDGGVTALALDLSACDHLDSTFLGTLISLHRSSLRINGGRFTVSRPSPQVAQELRHIALDKVLTLADVEPLDAPWTPLPCATPDAGSFQRNIVAAHQALAELPGEAGTTFKKVASRLTDEMQRERKT